MVERISRISSSAASARTEAGNTLNLGSDSQNAWVAARQSKINHDLEERRQNAGEMETGHEAVDEDEGAKDKEPPSSHWIEPSETPETIDDEAAEPRLSGESERIGTQNFDEDTPFGDRALIV